MGKIRAEYLIVELWGEDERVTDESTKKIDEFIEGLEEEYKSLFFKSITTTNKYIRYFMSWDGSKEGWDVDMKANEIREDFIKVVKSSYKNPNILQVFGYGHKKEYLKVVK